MYADGFLLPIPKKNVAAYRKIATKASKIWRDLGALEYRECIGDDLAVKGMVSFSKNLKTKPGETVVLAWIVYKSRADRDRINKKILTDPRITALGTEMPFDMKRMVYGGFKVMVAA